MLVLRLVHIKILTEKCLQQGLHQLKIGVSGALKLPFIHIIRTYIFGDLLLQIFYKYGD